MFLVVDESEDDKVALDDCSDEEGRAEGSSWVEVALAGEGSGEEAALGIGRAFSSAGDEVAGFRGWLKGADEPLTGVAAFTNGFEGVATAVLVKSSELVIPPLLLGVSPAESSSTVSSGLSSGWALRVLDERDAVVVVLTCSLSIPPLLLSGACTSVASSACLLGVPA